MNAIHLFLYELLAETKLYERRAEDGVRSPFEGPEIAGRTWW
jgi:hypothetical protein